MPYSSCFCVILKFDVWHILSIGRVFLFQTLLMFPSLFSPFLRYSFSSLLDDKLMLCFSIQIPNTSFPKLILMWLFPASLRKQDNQKRTYLGSSQHNSHLQVPQPWILLSLMILDVFYTTYHSLPRFQVYNSRKFAHYLMHHQISSQLNHYLHQQMCSNISAL